MSPALVRPIGRYDVVIVILLAGAFATLRVVVWPGVPVLLGGDQGVFWLYGQRLLHGELPYRDFFQFTPPGTDFVYRSAFALFGARVWVTNAVVVGLGAALAGVAFQLARTLVGRSEAALASALFSVWVFGELLAGTHHGWSMLVIMLAVGLLSPPETRNRLVGAGALLGVAAFFTQTHAAFALAASAGFVYRRRRRSPLRRRVALAWLLSGTVLVSAVVWLPVVHAVGMGPTWWCLVTYPWRYKGYTQIGSGYGLPEALTFATLPTLTPYLVVYAAVPIGYLLAVRARARGGLTEDENDTSFLLLVVGVALYAGVLVYVTWVRVFGVSMPAIVLLVWAAEKHPRSARWFRRAAWVATAVLAACLVRSTERHHAAPVDLPGGRVATDESTRAELAWLAAHDAPGGELFTANRQNFLLPLALRDPLYLDGGIPDGDELAPLVGRGIEGLTTSRLPMILWSPDEFRALLDGFPRSEFALLGYLQKNYRSAERFGNGDEVWVRRTLVSP